MGEDEKTYKTNNIALKVVYFFSDLIDKPITFIHDNIVEKNRQDYNWYHQRMRRVPTIDECYVDDFVCRYEAEEQYKRDRSVEKSILHILKRRYENCSVEERENPHKCVEIFKYYENAINNYFIKYGDLGMRHNAIACYMKQKHRMAWERRHGPVGTGRKEDREKLAEMSI